MEKIKLDQAINEKQAVIVNSGMEVLTTVRWIRAVKMVLANRAYTLIPRPDAVIESESLIMPHPMVVCLNGYVSKNRKTINHDDFVSKKIILARDKYTCQYCGNFGNTVDHILPKSRGGGNTWGNLCAACTTCNGKKSNLTPEEAHMPRPMIPASYTPTGELALQEAIYAELAEMV